MPNEQSGFTTYSFRAENFDDIAVAMHAIAEAGGRHVGIIVGPLDDENYLPDRLVEFRSDLDFAAIRRVFEALGDGHVMAQTLRGVPANQNSFARAFERDS